MNHQQQVRVSKFLSRHLRHAPGDLGLTLQPGGWVRVDDLLTGCRASGVTPSRADLEEGVRGSDKQRFAFDETGVRVRANQGHSVEVDLQLEAIEPPEQLYHGTGHTTADEILRTGLKRMRRHHVHLSATVETARAVGGRHGRPVVLVVDAGALSRAGVPFYRSAHGVWL